VAYPSDRDQVDPRQSFRNNISKETSLLAAKLAGRLNLFFTPKMAPGLKLIEGFSSKSRPLRPAPHAGVFKSTNSGERIMAGIDDVNSHPVIHTWSYRLPNEA